MSRSFFGGTPADYAASAVTVAGVPGLLQMASTTLSIHDARGGAVVSDLRVAGQPATAVVAPAGQTILFEGPDGWHKDLWGTPDGGTSWYRFSPSADANEARLAALEAASDSTLGGLADVSTAGAGDGDALTFSAATSTWVPGDAAGGTGLPAGGTTGQTLVKQTATDGDATWQTRGFVPTGGTTGQVLRKTSSTDHAAVFSDVVVGLTQAQYDALGTKDPGVLYVITSAATYPPSFGAAGSPAITFDTDTPFDTLSVPLPTYLPGDRLLLLTALRAAAIAATSVATPSGWTSLGSVTNGTTATFANGGSVRAQAFVKTAGSSEQAPVLTVGASYDPLYAVAVALGGTISGVTATTGTDTDDTTAAVSISGAANLSLTQNDLLVAFLANRSGNPLGLTDAALAAAGCTLTGLTQHILATSTTGNNATLGVWSARVASGTSSAAPTFTATSTYSPARSDGSMIFVRVAA